MGHASQIALGVALKSKKKIICLDGDGSFIMHMGGISTIGSLKLKNFIHIVINNYAHDYWGGQETSSVTSNLSKIALACSYNKVFPNINDKKKKNNALKLIRKTNGPILMEVIVKKGSRKKSWQTKRNTNTKQKIFIKNINK